MALSVGQKCFAVIAEITSTPSEVGKSAAAAAGQEGDAYHAEIVGTDCAKAEHRGRMIARLGMSLCVDRDGRELPIERNGICNRNRGDTGDAAGPLEQTIV
jgi:hypothetical protein